MSFQPPPRRTDSPGASSSAAAPPDPNAGGWKAKMKAKGAVWGKVAMDKGIALSDTVGAKVNDIAEKKFGTEHFYPVTGDFGREMDKCARILRVFTVQGIITEEPVPASGASTPTENKSSTKSKVKGSTKKVLRKIPPSVIANAKGLVIFTSMRTGFAPFGGAGGSGVVIAKLPDGTWSGPASISPNNLSAGFVIGVDVYDAVLVVNSQEALDSFKTHKPTLGAEIGIAAGPYGSGVSVEGGVDRAPIWSYVKSRGMYAGIQIIGQVFVERFDENAAMYHWPGVKAGDILAGKVKPPRESAALHQAISDAETGRAQAADPTKPDGAEVVQNSAGEMIIPDAGGVVLRDGEVMQLPPTPSMMVGDEAGIGAVRPVPTPPRLPSRPTLPKQHSSTSNYASTPEPIADPVADPFGPPSASDTKAPLSESPSTTTAPTHLPPTQPHDLPPAYPDDAPGYAAPAAPGPTGYPDEKAELKRRDELEAQSLGGGGSGAAPAEEMSESERREWAEAEEMIRLEKEEMERLAAAPTTAQAGTAADAGIPGGVAGMRLGEREV